MHPPVFFCNRLALRGVTIPAAARAAVIGANIDTLNAPASWPLVFVFLCFNAAIDYFFDNGRINAGAVPNTVGR